MIAVRQQQPEQTNTTRIRIVWADAALALTAAVAYVLTGIHVLAVNQPPAPELDVIPYIAAACYALGGLLILLRWRWLWIVGAVINAMVMLFFFTGYANRPEVMFSPGGMVTKAAQILLEVGLIYLIITYPRRSST
jgi:hypothetical protein